MGSFLGTVPQTTSLQLLLIEDSTRILFCTKALGRKALIIKSVN